ncbi:hypothetical protein [Halomonas sp. C22]|uniref:hypothetical protein n=1 Tax=Halomonas sp. C22 TaxID=2580567 RepID=UPI00119DECEC|nr:hypothetical protein [Halomonas sp. C22]
MMKSKKQSTSLVLAADYIFYLLPFIILTIISLAQEKLSDLLTISDWSIASTIIYGQLIVKLSAALAATNREKKIPAITLYLTILVCLGLVVNVVIYSLMLIMPSKGLGITQLILFGFASICHFIFGAAVGHINKVQ